MFLKIQLIKRKCEETISKHGGKNAELVLSIVLSVIGVFVAFWLFAVPVFAIIIACMLLWIFGAMLDMLVPLILLAITFGTVYFFISFFWYIVGIGFLVMIGWFILIMLD